MVNVFQSIFSSSGPATAFFGGQWFLVGLFLVLILAIYFIGKGFSAQSIAFFAFSSLVLLISDDLFIIDTNIFISIFVILVLYAGIVFAGVLVTK